MGLSFSLLMQSALVASGLCHPGRAFKKAQTSKVLGAGEMILLK